MKERKHHVHFTKETKDNYKLTKFDMNKDLKKGKNRLMSALIRACIIEEPELFLKAIELYEDSNAILILAFTNKAQVYPPFSALLSTAPVVYQTIMDKLPDEVLSHWANDKNLLSDFILLNDINKLTWGNNIRKNMSLLVNRLKEKQLTTTENITLLKNFLDKYNNNENYVSLNESNLQDNNSDKSYKSSNQFC